MGVRIRAAIVSHPEGRLNWIYPRATDPCAAENGAGIDPKLPVYSRSEMEPSLGVYADT